MAMAEASHLPPGAHVGAGGVTHFRVWAPAAHRVDVVLGPDNDVAVALDACGDGYFAGDAQAPAGTLYRFRLDGGDAFPDPASRYQPDGPHGPSEVVDPGGFEWSDAAWQGCGPRGQVLYEMHVGTFTPEGTYAAALEHLPYLRDLGVTVIELMPVNEFDGKFGWGYDGVNLFAPSHLYGRPDDLRTFVDRAHTLGLGVILDVVYNHLGPSGNYLGRFSPDYFTRKYDTEWGEAINFDGENSAAVRELFMANAAYWIREFHMDGLRLDATQCIYDAGPCHVLADITSAARQAAGSRAIFITAENEPQHAHLVRPRDQGGCGVDEIGRAHV